MKILTLDEAKRHVGEGWHSLLEEAFQKLPELQEIYHKTASGEQLTTSPSIGYTTVKEKFGGLRIYTNVWAESEEISTFLWSLESKSFTMCEFCGSEENVDLKSKTYWIKTVCTKCGEQHGFTNPVNQTFIL